MTRHKPTAEAAPQKPAPDAMRELVQAAFTKHGHVNMKWPASAQIDGSHIDAFVAEISAALSAPVPPPDALKEADHERVFADICDELGCAFDNEAALVAIASLKKRVSDAGAAEPRVVQRFQDELDAALAGSEWFEPIALALPKHPSNEIIIERVGADGNVRLLWHKGILQAAFMLVRDNANFTQLLKFRLECSPRAAEPDNVRSALAVAKRYAEFIGDDMPPEIKPPSNEQLGDALLVLAALRSAPVSPAPSVRGDRDANACQASPQAQREVR